MISPLFTGLLANISIHKTKESKALKMLSVGAQLQDSRDITHAIALS